MQVHGGGPERGGDGGQAEQGEGAAADIAGPVGAPPEPLRHLGDLLHVTGMPEGPLPIQVPRGLGQQQVQVRD